MLLIKVPVPNQVISVGDKDFRFTWSPETGELCDIYEERRSGEDGNGLLVESGCAWRKLNVQRVLDESTKNHVKMRSEEAERKLKSRKYALFLYLHKFLLIHIGGLPSGLSAHAF